MADYITSNIISQAYVHIDPIRIDESRLEALKAELELYLKTRGRFFIYDDVETSIEFEEGSLKVYAGAMGLLMLAISQYGSFRSGVDFLASDSKRLVECITTDVLFLTQTRHENTVRIEARIGVVGSLKGIIDTAELTTEEMTEVSIRKTIRRIEKIQEESERLLANLKDPRDVQYIGEKLCEVLRDILPKKLPSSPKRKPDQEEQIKYAGILRNILVGLERHGKGQAPKPIRKKRKRKKEKKIPKR